MTQSFYSIDESPAFRELLSATLWTTGSRFGLSSTSVVSRVLSLTNCDLRCCHNFLARSDFAFAVSCAIIFHMINIVNYRVFEVLDRYSFRTWKIGDPSFFPKNVLLRLEWRLYRFDCPSDISRRIKNVRLIKSYTLVDCMHAFRICARQTNSLKSLKFPEVTLSHIKFDFYRNALTQTTQNMVFCICIISLAIFLDQPLPFLDTIQDASESIRSYWLWLQATFKLLSWPQLSSLRLEPLLST